MYIHYEHRLDLDHILLRLNMLAANRNRFHIPYEYNIIEIE